MKSILELIARICASYQPTAQDVTELAQVAYNLGSLDGAASVAPVKVALPNLRAICMDLRGGNKISAIKVLRQTTNAGLKESKEWVEDLKSMFDNGTLPPVR